MLSNYITDVYVAIYITNYISITLFKCKRTCPGFSRDHVNVTTEREQQTSFPGVLTWDGMLRMSATGSRALGAGLPT